MNIEQIPFSMAGSYLAVSKLPERIEAPAYEEGVYLRSVHGMNYMPGFTMMRSIPFFARLIPTEGGTEAPYQIQASTDEVCLKTENGFIGICFGNRRTLLIRGQGVGLKLVFAAGNFAQHFCWEGREYFFMNCRTNDRRFALRCQTGQLALEKETDREGRPREIVLCGPADDWLLVLKDVTPDWVPQKESFDYEACRAARQRELEDFAASMPKAPERYRETAKLAAYVDWSCLVAKEGALTRDAMLMSKNWMCNVWSWDHCFNAIALSYHNPKLAWDQFMLLFDYQDGLGALPDSVSDAFVARSFLKPPIHGWALMKMMEHMELDDAQCRDAYEKLEKWTLFWQKYRDSDGDGICEYAHGHDSGWDNATVFRTGKSVELPDLAAFLILQMEALEKLAGRLGKEKEAKEWKQRSQKMLQDMFAHCFEKERPRCLVSGSHEEVEAQCLILYLPLLLGERLPKGVRNSLIRGLTQSGLRTSWGFATEATDSGLYDSDGYWRGPIWAPPTLFLAEGLRACGEEALAAETAERFCRMAKASGFAENYDAVTGMGLRDRAYTWTASIFLILAAEFLKG